jgi:cellobiose phosphorylase
VEGDAPTGVRMTLTGQVFPIMGGTATAEQVGKTIQAVNRYLLDPKIGGYRLNSNFHEVKLDMGRCFGFAFGHKENGAMFSHMAIMYGNALYKRGFIKEGHEVLSSLFNLCGDFGKARIYPGIPEYINEKRRGMYHYLTGSASWLLLTVLTEVFGIHGRMGDLAIAPKLVRSQFNLSGQASVHTLFAGKELDVVYTNTLGLEPGAYRPTQITLNGVPVPFRLMDQAALVDRSVLTALGEGSHTLRVTLG